MLKPEDIDFAVSETYRMGLSELHGWGYRGIEDYRTERECRFDDDLAETRRCKTSILTIPDKEVRTNHPSRHSGRLIGKRKGDRPLRGL